MPLSCGGKEEPELRAALAADAAKLIPGEAVRRCLQARWCVPAARGSSESATSTGSNLPQVMAHAALLHMGAIPEGMADCMAK